MAELYGADPSQTEGEGYEVPEEYSGQGDTRIVRALRFLYVVAVQDPTGTTVLEPREAVAGEEVSLEQIGLSAQMKGESSHAFYTDDEREALEAGSDPDAEAGSDADGSDVGALGEYELAEHIKTNNLTVNETIALANGDPDMAHRVLQAENIATDGEPRKGVEQGLTSIIESS
jgi:hypothetical protein